MHSESWSVVVMAHYKFLSCSNGTLYVTVIAAAIFFYVSRRGSIQKDETLIDSYNDIRETIYNYDEEGMPEEDQDGYDISRLSKPVTDFVQPVSTKPLGRAPPRMCNYIVISPLWLYV